MDKDKWSTPAFDAACLREMEYFINLSKNQKENEKEFKDDKENKK